MVSAKSEFPWEEAWQVWVELRDQLRPVCRKIVPAGSLRRRQPVVHDLDVVAIPLLAVQHDLFGNPTKEYSRKGTADFSRQRNFGFDLLSTIRLTFLLLVV